MILHESKNYYAGKPCFTPWNNLSIPYDALLSISVSVKGNTVVPLYLRKYVKSPGHLELLITTDKGDVVVALDQNIDAGISNIHYTSDDDKFHTSMVLIDSPDTEESHESVQISPLYITYQSKDITVDSIVLDNVSVPLSGLPLQVTGNVDIKENGLGDIEIAVSPHVYDVTSYTEQPGVPYIHSFNGTTLYKEDNLYTAKLVLPDKLRIINKTVNTVNLVSDTISGGYSTDLVIYRPETPESDDCTAAKLFDKDVDTGYYTYNPDRVLSLGFENYKTQLAWDQLASRHDGEDAELEEITYEVVE